MSFMEMQIYRKGQTYCCDCEKCGMTHYIHEWTTDAFNDDKDAMQDGSARCPECGGALKSVIRSTQSKNPSFVEVPGRKQCKRCQKWYSVFIKDKEYPYYRTVQRAE